MEPWPIADGDTVLLASDGLFKTLSTEEMLGSLHGRPQAWPDALVARTLAKAYEYQDNVTVLSVTVQDRPDTVKLPPPAVGVEKTAPDRDEEAVGKMGRGGADCRLRWRGVAAGGGRWWYKKHHAAGVAEKK